ncbi:MAG: ABC transporter permease [Candidatus Hermodarchaeota archaeon]
MWKHVILSNRLFMVALAVFFLIIAFGLIGPFITRHPLDEVRGEDGRRLIRHPPTLELPLGTDDFGFDVFAQLAHAVGNSLFVGFFAGSIVVLIAVSIGAFGTFRGGYLEEALMLITNIVIVLPVFPILLVLAAYLDERSLLLVGLIIAGISWPWAARGIRSQVLSLKERDFVRLARVSGMRDINIAFQEILPNMFAYILLVMAIATGGAIVAEAGISMLGLGPDPQQYVTLGTMLYWAIQNETIRSGFWWLYLPPGLIITFFWMALYIIHANMDEVFNPRLRRR